MTSKKIFYCLFFTMLSGHCIVAQNNLEITIIKPKTRDSCGISTGGPLVQQLSTTVSYSGAYMWTDNGAKIVYTDRFGSAMGRYQPQDGRFYRGLLPEAEEYTCVFPVKDRNLSFVVGQDQKLVLNTIRIEGSNQIPVITDLLTITHNKQEIVFIAKTDNKGVLWVATGSANGSPIGNLYKIDNLTKPEIMETKLHEGAGMAWSIDNRYFYLVDTHLRVIYQYNFNSATETISNRQIVFDLKNHPDLGGVPFDIEVDNLGHLWIGMRRGSSVIQYDIKTKQILWQIPLPTTDVVSLAFGMADRRTLFVGTTKFFLKTTKDQPAAGAMFAISGLGVYGPTHGDIVIPETYLSSN